MKRNGRTVHVYSSDEKPITPMQMLGGFLIVISGLIVIWLGFVVANYWVEIKHFFKVVVSFILINKYYGGIAMLILLLIVSAMIKRYAKKGNF